MKKTKSRRESRKYGAADLRKGSTKTIMKCSGKFLHGTRGKPGRGPHGDKHY